MSSQQSRNRSEFPQPDKRHLQKKKKKKKKGKKEKKKTHLI